MANKRKLMDLLIEMALDEVDFLEEMEDEEESIEQILDDLEEDLSIVLLHRYTFRENVPKNYIWYENILPNLSDDRFNTLVRIERDLFNVILDLIKDHEIFHGTNSHKQFSVFFQLAVVCYRLGGSSTIRKTATLFGIGDGGTISKITNRVFTAILSLENIFVTWPTHDERDILVCETQDELPLCVGYLDGTEIGLEEAPTLDKESYFSRTKQYSIKLQAICDHKKRIRQFHVGYPGSVHDSRVFKSCQIGTNPSKFLSDGQWIAADSAYKLTEYVVTPFRRNSTKTTAEKRKIFNTYFSGYRVRIEHCFGLLKNKFASLKKLNIKIWNAETHKNACTWVRVCCILHNIILPHLTEEDFNFSSDAEEEVEENLIFDNSDEIGELKRQSIFEAIFNDFF